MDKVEQRKLYVEYLSPHRCPRCEKPTIIQGQYCSSQCGMKAAEEYNKK